MYRRITLTRPQPDAGLRGLRTMAYQVLCPEMGGYTPRTATFPATLQLPPGSVGHRTCQPRGINNKPEPSSIMTPGSVKAPPELYLSLGAQSGKLGRAS